MFYRPHQRVTYDCGDIMVTKQHYKDECDIHTILKQYQRTGIITHVQNSRPTYEDLPSDIDFQTALHIQMQAVEAFEGLPSKVRDHFANDPERLLRALNDPDQHAYLREVGILKAPAPAPSVPDSVPVPSPSPGAGAV